MQGAELIMTQKQTAKGQLLATLTMQGMELMKQVITPSKGFVIAQGQAQELKGDDLKEAQKSAVLFDELEDLKNATTYELTGIETFNGEEAYVLKKEKQTVYYSVATGLKLASVEVVEAQGQTHEMTTAYSDYKEVKGIKFAHAFTVPMLGNAEFKVSEIKVNEGVSDADFK